MSVVMNKAVSSRATIGQLSLPSWSGTDLNDGLRIYMWFKSFHDSNGPGLSDTHNMPADSVVETSKVYQGAVTAAPIYPPLLDE